MQVLPLKDPSHEHPIADDWRPTIREIVRAFAEGDYELARGVRAVTPPSTAKAERMREYVADYGETLTELPDETWKSSVTQWMAVRWDAMVDLWTVESGRSDLALYFRVFEVEDGFRFEIASLHVP